MWFCIKWNLSIVDIIVTNNSVFDIEVSGVSSYISGRRGVAPGNAPIIAMHPPPLPPFPRFVVSRNCERILTPTACLLGWAVTLLVDFYYTCTHYNEGDCPYCIPPPTTVREWGITVIATKSGC